MAEKKEMKRLEVGDKVYNKEHARWGGNVYYRFEVVERLTKTQAVLSNGIKLINEPVKSSFSKDTVGYSVHDDRWKKWHIQTDEIILEAKAEKERQTINSWFELRKFTESEKQIVYLKFDELGILEAKEETN